MTLMTLSLPVALLLIFVAIVGLGTSGTQILIYGFTAGYYPAPMRGAGVAWCAGFGRLGGVAGPLLGGFLLAAGLAVNVIFLVLAGIGLVGALITLLVQRSNRPMDIHSTPIEPTTATAP
jgi:AAHS family benzoate transporter-like MFS transporter